MDEVINDISLYNRTRSWRGNMGNWVIGVRERCAFQCTHFMPFEMWICCICGCWVAQACLTLCEPMDCSLPDSSVHWIFQARILELVVISYSRGSSQPRDWTQVPCISRWLLYHWATQEALYILCELSNQKRWIK